jgi:hypothetical protein
MTRTPQLECRIVIIHHRETRSVEIGMYDPLNSRYECLGRHRPDEVNRVVTGLKRSIEGAGHRLTFCERSEG